MKFKYDTDNRVITILSEDDAEAIQITPEVISGLRRIPNLDAPAELANMIHRERPSVNVCELYELLKEIETKFTDEI